MAQNLTSHKTGNEWAFVVLVSDGISSILSDDEIVDLARDATNPKSAAERILAFSEELGGDDNATAIIVPLLGWGKVQGPDKTKDLREYRRRQSSQFLLYFLLLPNLTQDSSWIGKTTTNVIVIHY